MARTSHSLQIQNRRVGESLPMAISTSSRLQAGGQEDSSRVEKSQGPSCTGAELGLLGEGERRPLVEQTSSPHTDHPRGPLA